MNERWRFKKKKKKVQLLLDLYTIHSFIYVVSIPRIFIIACRLLGKYTFLVSFNYERNAPVLVHLYCLVFINLFSVMVTVPHTFDIYM